MPVGPTVGLVGSRRAVPPEPGANAMCVMDGPPHPAPRLASSRGSSIAVGVVAIADLNLSWLPVVFGLAGSGVLLYGTVLLVSEARLGVTSTLKEMDFVSGLITRHKGDDVLS